MYGRTALVALALVALALVGCGKGGEARVATTTTLTAPSTPFKRTRAREPFNSVSYTVHLAGFSEGSPNGSAVAEISVSRPSLEICWKFSNLVNVTAPTVARIYAFVPGGPGTHGLRLGPRYTSSGCEPEPYAVLEDFALHPRGFRVSIHDAQFPGGAVRGALSL